MSPSGIGWADYLSSTLNFEMLIEVGRGRQTDNFTMIPASCSFIFRVSSLPTNHPLSSSKLRSSSSLSFCRCAHSNPKNPITDPTSSAFSSNHLSILSPFLRGVKDLVRSQAQKWSFCLPANVVSEVGGPGENGGNYLQKNGGFGVALLSITTNAKHRISPFVATLASNPTFISGFCGLFFAQLIKVLINFFVERKWDWRIMFASGGMPSSHSALCTALTTSVALCHGVADSLFPVCLGFSLIVMYDAIGVRRHAGMQAEVLNMIVADLFQGHPISQRKLKELLGHTPSQVLAGALFGILVACVCCQDSLIGA